MTYTARRDNFGKWRVLSVFWLISFCNYADRTILSVVIPKLKAEFHADDFRLGLISGGFLWAYACSAFASGYLADRYSRASMVRWGLLIWSLLFVLMSFTNSLLLFGILIALAGVAEASYYPAGLALISSYHSSTRTKALSIHQTAVFAGVAIGGYVAARVAEFYSWRSAYLYFGGAGILLAMGIWSAFNKASRVSKRMIRLVTVPAERQPCSATWHLLRAPGYIPLVVLYVGANIVTYALLTWLPTFLHDARSLSLSNASIYGLGSFNLATLLTVVLGGVVGDRIVRAGTDMRRVFLAIMLAFFGGSISLLNLCPNLAWTIVVLVFAGTFKGLFDANIYAAVHDVVLPQDRAGGIGLLTALGFTGAAASSVIVGIAGGRNGLGIGLSISGIICCVGACVIILVLRLNRVRNPVNTRTFT